MSAFLSILAIAAGAYVFLALFAHFTANSVIFRPPQSSYQEHGDLIRISADDGTPLAAVHLVAPHPLATVLFLHGNSEDLGDIRPRLEAMRAHGLNVLAFDYRGYGLTPGTPSERRVNEDAARVFRYLVEECGVPARRIVLYGRSLGSGPAIELATQHSVRGLIIEGAFKSTYRVVTQVPLLPGDRFRNLERIPHIRCPALVIHGEADFVTPASHGKALFAAAPNPKRSLWVPGAGHNDVVELAGASYWEAMEAVARGLGPA